MYSIERLTSSQSRIVSGSMQAYYDNEVPCISLSRFPTNENDKFLSDNLLEESLIDLQPKSPFPDDCQRKSLGRLTVNTTQSCNLHCTYCYAEYGLYGKNYIKSSDDYFKSLALSIVEKYYNIERVQFFGGEPLLQPDRIRIFCEVLSKAADLNLLQKRPRFSIVTNGTLLSNSEIIDLICQWNIAVTVSLDGPRRIVDRLRPQANGHSAYADICNGINALKTYNRHINIEATYTSVHQEMDCSVLDIIAHARDIFGLRSVHVAPATFSPWGDLRPNQESASQDFFNAALESVRRVRHQEYGILSSAYAVLEKLSQSARSTAYCPAFTEQLSIDCEGGAYPCFMAMSNRETRLGNIITDSWPTLQSKSTFDDYLQGMKKGSFGNRHKVWFDSLISACAAADLLNFGYYGEDSDFKIHEGIVAGTILGVSTFCEDML
ncbi:MAG: radical SAM protein [Cyanobacteria bacterium P01_D01_bin.6]